MNNNEIKKGSIVVVLEGATFGCPPNTITKVASKPGRISDAMAILYGKFYTHETFLTMCVNPKSSNTCNLKPASYELISDLRLATESEKKEWKMNNNQPVFK